MTKLGGEVPWSIKTGQVFQQEPTLTPINKILTMAEWDEGERREFDSFADVQNALAVESGYTIPSDFAKRLDMVSLEICI